MCLFILREIVSSRPLERSEVLRQSSSTGLTGGEFGDRDRSFAGTALEALEIELTNVYPRPSSLVLYPWSLLAEPHRSTTLRVVPAVSDAGEGLSDAGLAGLGEMDFVWSITYFDTGSKARVAVAENLNGSSVTWVFLQASLTYDVNVDVLDRATGSPLRSPLSAPVTCKYVRREIRSLTDTDRSRFLDATEKFYRLSAEEGKALYGYRFTNYQEATVKHLAKMTLDLCTPFHNADVFFTAHDAFVLEFEQALQAVDPSVSVPYWDYTIDASGAHEWWKDSAIWRLDYFGPLNNSATGNRLQGRFKGIKTAFGYENPEHNSWGVNTDVMNNNPSREVTRAAEICGLPTHSALPSCHTLKGLFNQSAISSLSDFESFIEVQLHATVHMQMGGMTDCPFLLSDAVSRWPALTKFFEGLALQLNTLYRTMYTKQDSYSSGTPNSTSLVSSHYNSSSSGLLRSIPLAR